MNTFQLECFLTVAETLNFARAAENLNITQPAVTHQIRSLEEELDVKLFHRTTRSVELTSAGLAFLNDARGMMEISIRAKKRFEDPSGREIQPFALGFQSYTQQIILPDLLRRLHGSYPNLHPRFQVAPFQHLCHMLEEESLEAFISFQEPALRKKALRYREISQSSLCFVCAEDHPMAGEKKADLHQAERERIVLSSPLHTPSSLAHLHRELIGARSPAELYFCETQEDVLTLVRAGYGVALMPAAFVPPGYGLALVAVERLPHLSYGIYYKTLKQNRILRDLIRLLQEEPEREE